MSIERTDEARQSNPYAPKFKTLSRSFMKGSSLREDPSLMEIVSDASDYDEILPRAQVRSATDAIDDKEQAELEIEQQEGEAEIEEPDNIVEEQKGDIDDREEQSDGIEVEANHQSDHLSSEQRPIDEQPLLEPMAGYMLEADAIYPEEEKEESVTAKEQPENQAEEVKRNSISALQSNEDNGVKVLRPTRNQQLQSLKQNSAEEIKDGAQTEELEEELSKAADEKKKKRSGTKSALNNKMDRKKLKKQKMQRNDSAPLEVYKQPIAGKAVAEKMAKQSQLKIDLRKAKESSEHMQNVNQILNNFPGTIDEVGEEYLINSMVDFQMGNPDYSAVGVKNFRSRQHYQSQKSPNGTTKRYSEPSDDYVPAVKFPKFVNNFKDKTNGRNSPDLSVEYDVQPINEENTLVFQPNIGDKSVTRHKILDHHITNQSLATLMPKDSSPKHVDSQLAFAFGEIIKNAARISQKFDEREIDVEQLNESSTNLLLPVDMVNSRNLNLFDAKAEEASKQDKCVEVDGTQSQVKDKRQKKISKDKLKQGMISNEIGSQNKTIQDDEPSFYSSFTAQQNTHRPSNLDAQNNIELVRQSSKRLPHPRSNEKESGQESGNDFGGDSEKSLDQRKKDKWYPISEIEEGTKAQKSSKAGGSKQIFELQTMEQKREHMAQVISELADSNEAYFSGKELRFDNRASFFQCVVDPVRPGGYIAAQKRLESQPYSKVWKSKKIKNVQSAEEVKKQGSKRDHDQHWWCQGDEIFTAPTSDPYLLVIGETSDSDSSKDVDNEEELGYNDARTIISYWKQNDALAVGQYECWNMVQERIVLEKTIKSQEGELVKQCLFTGLNKKVFYFAVKSFDGNDQDSFSQGQAFQRHDSIHLCIKSNQNDVTRKYEFPFQGKLAESLKKQLGIGTSQASFSFPDPSIVCLNEIDYLVLTDLDDSFLPNLAFYRLEQDNTDGEAIGRISNSSKFRINRAELLVGYDNDSVSVLTNIALLSDYRPTEQEEYLKFARLSSPSLVIKVPYSLLVSSSPDPLEQAEERLTLTSGRHGTLVFRTESYDFPCVEAMLATHAKGITFRFFGSDQRSSICLHFTLSNAEEQGDNQFTGSFFNQEDQLVRVDGTLRFEESGNNFVSRPSSSGKAKHIRVRQEETLTEDWIQTKTKKSQKALPFSIQKLEFDAVTGKIDLSQLDIRSGQDEKFDVKQVEHAHECFSEEHSFMFHLESSTQNFTIKGCSLHQPLNTMIIGQLVDSSGTQAVNFAIKKQTSARIVFEDSANNNRLLNGFTVTFMDGYVKAQRQDYIEIQLFDQPTIFYKFVHRIVVAAEDEGTYIFHGDMRKLLDNSSKEKNFKAINETAILKVTKISNMNAQKVESEEFIKLGSEKSVTESLNQRGNAPLTNHLMQAIHISNNQINFAYLCPQAHQDTCSLRFVTDELQTKNSDDSDQKSYSVSGLIQQQFLVYYPLLAYNSYLPDNSELVITNMASRDQTPQIVNLEHWRFVTFVQSPCQSGVFDKGMVESHSQIFFVAWHSSKLKLRLLMLEQDPWRGKIKLSVLKTSDISPLPSSLDQLVGAHFLAYKKAKRYSEFRLLFQYKSSLWSASLQQSGTDPMVDLLGQESGYIMKQRLLVRCKKDKDHVYCLVQSGTRDEILKIGINSERQNARLNITSVYESAKTKLIALEPDPESTDRLFVLDEEQRVITIEDTAINSDDNHAKGIKACILRSDDMSEYSLEDEIALLEQKPFASIAISQRIFKIENISVGLLSSLQWYDQNDDTRKLLDEWNLPGTLCSIQHWINSEDKSTSLCCKPLAGTNCVDLMGQYRQASSMKAYVASDDLILLLTKDKSMIFFDRDGYIVDEMPHEVKELRAKQIEIKKHSTYGLSSSRFFLISEAGKERLLQCYNKNKLRLIKGNIPMTDKEIIAKVEKEIEGLSGKPLEIADKLMMQDGNLIVLITAEVDLVEMKKVATILGESMEMNKKDFVFVRITKNSIACVVPCTSIQQKKDIMESIKAQQQISYKLSHMHVDTDDKMEKGNKQNPNSYKKSKTTKNKTPDYETKIVFGVIGSNLTWLNLQDKLVAFVDLKKEVRKINKNLKNLEQDVGWTSLPCKTFSVEKLLKSFEHENKAISINEIPPNSIRHKKESFNQDCSANSFIQITIGSDAIIKDMDGNDLALIHSINEFLSPFEFLHTGFDCNQAERSFETSPDGSLAVQRPSPPGQSKLAFKAMSEMDLQQVQNIAQVVERKRNQLQKSDITVIEPEVLTKPYGHETFFSLFFELDAIYNYVHVSLKNGTFSEILSSPEEHQSFLRALGYVLDKPTPVQVKVLDPETNNRPVAKSILKQCLLFHKDRAQAMVSIYKIAEHLDLYLGNYIDCLSDLALIIDKLPAQVYRPVLDKLDENFITKKITHASMPKDANMKVIRTASPFLDLEDLAEEAKLQKDTESRPVTVRVLPLDTIMPKQEMFNTIKNNSSSLQGSMFFDAIFLHFWPKERQVIKWLAFFPFIFYWLLANFYYTQCLYRHDTLVQGIWTEVEFIYSFGASDEPQWTNEDVLKDSRVEPIAFTLFTWLLIQQFANELIQFCKKERKLDYFKSNYYDAASFLMNILTLVLRRLHDYDQIGLHTVRVFASIALVLIYTQLFYRLGTAQSLAFYVDLITQTVSDIKNFIVVLILFILTFHSGTFMIQLNRMEDAAEESGEVLDSDASYLYNKNLLSMYYLLLGDYNEVQLIAGSEGGALTFMENMLSLFFFLGATFLTQITILNMLIAIMSETYGSHTSDKDAATKRNALQVQAKFNEQDNFYQLQRKRNRLCCIICSCFSCYCCTKREREEDNVNGYLFVMTLSGETEGYAEAEQVGEDMGGAITALSRKVDERFKAIDTFLNKKVLKSLVDLSTETGSRLDQLEQNHKYNQDTINKDTQTKFNKLQEKLQDMQEKMQDTNDRLDTQFADMQTSRNIQRKGAVKLADKIEHIEQMLQNKFVNY